MSKDIALKIKKIIASYLNENEADDFNLGSEIEDIIYRKARDLPIEDQEKLYTKAIPLLLNTKVSKVDKVQLKNVFRSFNNTIHGHVYDIFVHETKIELTDENDHAIYNFFAAKDNHGSNQSRKEGLAVLINALQKAHDAI